MKPPSSQYLLKIIELLDWTGHVELPSHDMRWLSEQLSASLQPKKHRQCEVCGDLKPIVIEVGNAGRICEECLREAVDEVDEIREELES